jgi:hypothetical protein
MSEHIEVNLVKYSINHAGQTISSFEWDYPRMVHCEVMTHHSLSKNSSSSRAVPAAAVRKQVLDNPVLPQEWSKNQAGMSADNQLSAKSAYIAEKVWVGISKLACGAHYLLEKCKLHKQYVNRILEPWSTIKIVITGTEWNNFLWLRDHGDAQPEMQTLARLTAEILANTTPELIHWNQWHLPYVHKSDFKSGKTLDDLKLISESCCAQTSYRKNDPSLSKAHTMRERLTSGTRVHASPFEHQAKATRTNYPVTQDSLTALGEHGYTHVDVGGNWWSGNLKGWVQNRQLIPNHDKKG